MSAFPFPPYKDAVHPSEVVKSAASALDHNSSNTSPKPLIRPSFNARITSDRLRESSNSLPRSSLMATRTNIRKDRKSLFKEVGLDDDDNNDDTISLGSDTVLGAMLSDKELGDLGGFSPTSPRRSLFGATTEEADGELGDDNDNDNGDDVDGGRDGGRRGMKRFLLRRKREERIGESDEEGRQEGTGGGTTRQQHQRRLSSSPPSPTMGNTIVVGRGHSSCINSSISRSNENSSNSNNNKSAMRWYSRLTAGGGGGRRPRIKAASSAPPPPTASSLSRVTMIAMLIAVVLPGFSYNNGRETVGISGADAGAVVVGRSRTGGGSGDGDYWLPWRWGGGGDSSSADPAAAAAGEYPPNHFIEPRANSPTQICTRWAHQAAMLNGTVYIYGGQAKTTAEQTTDTWNNHFLTLDLTKSWDVSTPILNGLPQPSGPPKVSMGYLWNDYTNLFLYGGEFADNPFVPPTRSSVWRYAIRSGVWTEHESPLTSAGNFSEAGGSPVQRSAEGAGLSVSELGLSFYFGGHLDLSTTPGWSNQVARVYLKSLLEFTHPGYTNDGVDSLRNDGGPGGGTRLGAGEFGVYRNITQGGLQNDQAFFERADGVLVFIPGWGDMGVLIGMGGGTNTTFANNFATLDVYDIARSEWFHQETKGTAPSVRVNPCAVVAVAADASSFQVYLYGGQNLEPYKEQVQYSDLWILSIPSFTWIQADPSSGTGSHVPPPRAGHTCHMRDGQMVLVGGYVGASIPCDSPGIYVLDASTLQWTGRFVAADPGAHAPDFHPENSVLAGSYGYRVPDKVVSAIGGGPQGGATVTKPVTAPTGGPFATGRSPVFTVTNGGETVTETSWGPGATGGGNGGGGGAAAPAPGAAADGSEARRQGGLIAAGAIAGLAVLAAGYLGFCAWLYRRQVRAYRTHLAAANRYSGAGGGGAGASHASLGGFAAAIFGRKGSKESRKGEGRPGAGAGASRWKTVDVVGGGGGGGMGEHGEKDDEGGGGGGYGHGRQFSASSMGAESFAWVGRRESLGAGPQAVWLEAGDLTPGSGTTVGGPVVTTSSSGFASPMQPSGSGSGSGLGFGYDPGAAMAMAAAAAERERERELERPRTSGSGASSTAGLLDGQEPSFFSVVMAPRRALRVVNGLHEGEKEQD